MQVINRKIVSNKGTFEFYKGLLNMELNKYEFKILTMVLALKNDNKIYSGTLKDMCEFLSLGYNSTNKKNIKNALDDLVTKGMLRYDAEKTIYTIRLDLDCNDKNIVQLDKVWLDTIKKYRADKKGYEVDWSNLLKVFIYLIDNNNNVIDTEKIQASTNLSASIVKKALAAINDINKQGGFGCGFTVERKRNYEVFSFNTDISKSQPKNEDEVIINENKIAIEINGENDKHFNEDKKKFQCTGMNVRCGYSFDFK